MNPTEIIQQALADGVLISADGAGGIDLSGDEAMVADWLPFIRENKPAILAALTPKQTPAPCQGCPRLEAVKIQGKEVCGCLYEIPGTDYPHGWKRLPADITRCIFH